MWVCLCACECYSHSPHSHVLQILGPCIVDLWKSPYLALFKPRNTDLLLSVVRLLVESTENIEAGLKKWEAKEKEAKEKEAKKKAEEAAQQAASAPPPPPSSVQRLMDMSFTRDQAEEALKKCNNVVEQAMEWLLNKPHVSSTPGEGSGRGLQSWCECSCSACCPRRGHQSLP